MYKYNLGISFEEIAEKYSDNIALKFNVTDSVSYRTLNNKSNQIARYLMDNNIRQNDVVCISGDKKLNTFASMIACLKIGAIYTIFDPESPAERLKKIIITCLPKTLFIESEIEQKVDVINNELNAVIIKTDKFEEDIKHFDNTNLMESRSITGTNPAYIMFTSGSTGFPKGAVMTHNNVLNLIDWSIETFNFTSDDIFTNVNPLFFDNSVFDFYNSLFSGACLVPFSKDTVTNPQSLVILIDELRCTSWFSVPSLLIFLQTMKVLDKSNMKFIKRFVFGGEGYPKSKLKKLYDIYSDRSELYNVYGPTECTCMCSSYKITSEDFVDLQGFPALGKIADNFSYLILDKNKEKVKDGDIGELCLLGPNVGKGYCNDHERTHVSFVQNPFNEQYEEKMYKTGDLVKYISDDNKIYFIGRSDNQIKHMGYRIELEEIETALSCLAYVSHAVVLHGNSRDFSQIVAIVSTENGIMEKTIREDLKQIIPSYMIPTNFYFERELPKNSNGKVDRIRLSEKYLRREKE